MADKIDLEDNNALLESLNELAHQYRNTGWVPLDGLDNDSGMDLDNLKGLSEQLQDMTETNPLLIRGAQLRYGYTFGRGLTWEKTRNAKKVIEEPYNYATLFTPKAWEELNKARFATGNIFVQRNKQTNELTRIPIGQITGVITDPESAERIWAFQRTWTANGKEHSRWIANRPYNGKAKSFKGPDGKTATLDPRYVMYHDAFNKQVGWTWGVPDAMGALVWSIAYSEYLKNNAKLVRAYARYAFKVTSQTAQGQNAAAAQVRGPARVAGTAVQGPGADLSPVPPTGSQVDFSKGTALASMVAASLGVSVIALLSDPSSAAGSYGSAQTLDAPTIRGMAAIQESWTSFFELIVRDMGAPNATVKFPNIETDTPYRQAQILTAGTASGLLHREEAREKFVALADVENILPGLPKLDEFTETITQPGQGVEGTPGMVTDTKTRDEE